jgi:(p)ppGpp synthase/HD superfamily hydrolase
MKIHSKSEERRLKIMRPDLFCKHCGFQKELANPSGFCNHVHYPEGCDICRDAEYVGSLPMVVGRAYRFAQSKHKDQLDDEGKSYFDAHLLNVFNILQKVTKNEAVLAAGLLHDTIEDTNTSYDELLDNFGKEIADLVMEVTHEGEKDSYGRYFPRLKSQHGIMIKLADRLSNISRMEAWDIARREHYLRKTKFWKDGSDRKL